MENEDPYRSLLEGAHQSSHIYHKIFLLRNLRTLRNDISKKSLQKFQCEIARNIGDRRRSAHFVESDMLLQMEKIVNYIPAVLDYISSALANLNGDEIEASNSYQDAKLDCQMIAGLDMDLNQITDFMKIIELLGKLFNTTGDEKFFKEQEQLVEIVNMMKNYKLSDEKLKIFHAKYEQLCSTKEQLLLFLRGDIRTIKHEGV